MLATNTDLLPDLSLPYPHPCLALALSFSSLHHPWPPHPSASFHFTLTLGRLHLSAPVRAAPLNPTAIWLKTRTPTLILLAALPITLIAFVKYREGEDDLFLKVVDLISERGLVDRAGAGGGPVPAYEHVLLQSDWMPEFPVRRGEETEELGKALDKWKRMRKLFARDEEDKNEDGEGEDKKGKKTGKTGRTRSLSRTREKGSRRRDREPSPVGRRRRRW